ncbi:MAG: hypothetical protein ACFB03_20550, partial [Paracoccaceae bacterium]
MIRQSLGAYAVSADLAAGLAHTRVPAVAADVKMNLGFGAPEESLYGRFAKIFKAKAEEYTGGSVEVK